MCCSGFKNNTVNLSLGKIFTEDIFFHGFLRCCWFVGRRVNIKSSINVYSNRYLGLPWSLACWRLIDARGSEATDVMPATSTREKQLLTSGGSSSGSTWATYYFKGTRASLDVLLPSNWQLGLSSQRPGRRRPIGRSPHASADSHDVTDASSS